MFKIINDWLNQITKVPLERIRDMLQRVEQFRSDALILPQIVSEGKKEQQAGVVIGAGAKSAGSINDAIPVKQKVNKGETSLTGKNPFAILKASTIANLKQATFPNNFTNLPKATPPFLGPMQTDKKYCLVLDLDETLIHNVDVSHLIITPIQYGSESFFLIRPGCVQFIQTMAKYYEIVIFTAAM